jgi:hypothetical protein
MSGGKAPRILNLGVVVCSLFNDAFSVSQTI